MRDKIIGLIVTITLGLFAKALPTNAQESGKVYQIGFLGPDSARNSAAKRFLEQFRELGWIEGKHFVMVYQTAPNAQLDKQVQALATKLVQQNVDIIITFRQQSTLAAKAATTTIPIVMGSSALPVENGLIESYSWPGGNVTGLVSDDPSKMAGKRLQLLKEAVPDINRIAYLYSPWAKEHITKKVEQWWEANGKQLGIDSLIIRVTTSLELEDAFARIVQFQADAIFLPNTAIIVANKERIMAFASAHRLPAFTNSKRLLKAGSLLYYRGNPAARHRRVAYYVDKILKGVKPADLPVELPDKFDLIVNLKAAEQLGITIPAEVLYQATEVIR